MKVIRVPQQDKRLGRQVVHDPRSRAFPARVTVDTSTWRTRSLRIYDPRPNPNQCHGECTGVDRCIAFNTVGNRVLGKVLNMDDAHRIYSLATTLDPWDGSWPPDDTGSSGLAAAKAAVQLGLGGEYRHVFGGADEAIQLVVDGIPVGIGAWWYWDMFDPDERGLVSITGGRAGGHQWALRGYDEPRDEAIGRCWWGEGFRDFRIKRTHLAELLADDGDAIVQERVG